jgi:hypothetical protein
MPGADFVAGLRRELGEIDGVSLADDFGISIINEHLGRLVAHEAALFRYVDGEGFVASAEDFALVARGLAALRRATTDEIDFFDGRRQLLMEVTDRVAALFGEASPRRCDYVGPRNGRICLKQTLSVDGRGAATLSGRGLAAEDFFCRLTALLEQIADGPTDRPVLTPVYASLSGAPGGGASACPRAVCRGCARGISDSDLVAVAAAGGPV